MSKRSAIFILGLGFFVCGPFFAGPPLADAAAGDACGISIKSETPANASDVAALASATQPVALYRLGLAYAVGASVPQDCQRAAAFIVRAAAGGVGAAQNALGEMYEASRGLVRSDRDAAKWYRAAYEQGDARGTYNLGRLIAEDRADGYGITANAASSGPTFSEADVLHSTQRDWSIVAALWQQSSTKGDPLAAYKLGQLYESGQGVSKDLYRAMQLYQQAADAGIPGARESLQALKQKLDLEP